MSTQDQLAVSYDVSNDFFKLWLDKRMNYSGALFDHEQQTLEQAQFNKLKFFHDKTHCSPASRVLDVGCGWGGLINFLATDMGLRDVTGITLSREQYAHLAANPTPGVSVACVSYEDYEPEKPFDSVISIGMFEHLATPEQARSGESVAIYRNYFHKIWQWAKPGARFGLQTVIGGRIPRQRQALRDLAWATTSIFPGAISPRLEVIAASVNPYWEILELHTRRKHYERTTREWLKRLNDHQDTIEARWGSEILEDYRRYLGACITCFKNNYQSLAQIILRRIDR